MMKPKISIIVPIYNVEKYLDCCVKSLLDQTLKDIEIILVDDCSPDNSPQICDKWATKDSRIKVIHKSVNEGLGEARNTGLKYVTGDYVAFVDSDDFVSNDMYETLYEQLCLIGADTCYCGYYIYDGINSVEIKEGIDSDVLIEGKENIEDFLLNMIGLPTTNSRDSLVNMCVWRAIYSMDIIKRNNITFVSERKISSEDIIFHLCYLPFARKICYTTQCKYFYRYTPNSISHSYPKWKYDALVMNCRTVKSMLESLFEKEKYHDAYLRHLFRYIKTMVKKECKNDISFLDKNKNIKKCCNEVVFEDLFEYFKYQNLPLTHQIYFLLLKYRLTPLLICFVNIFR